MTAAAKTKPASPQSKPLISAEEWTAQFHKGWWYLVGLLLLVASFYCIPAALKEVWPLLVDRLGDTILLGVVAAYAPNVGQQFIWNAVMWPIYLGYGPAWLEQFKINPKPWPFNSRNPAERAAWWAVVRKAAFQALVVNNIIVGIPIFVLLYYRLHFMLGFLPVSIDQWPSYATLAWQLPAAMIVEDICFYTSHRLLHTPFLYARIHKTHHAFSYNTVLASENAHPVEFLLGNLNPVIIPALLFKFHLATFSLWILLRIFISAEEHCGYAFPWSPCRLLPFQASVEGQ